MKSYIKKFQYEWEAQDAINGKVLFNPYVAVYTNNNFVDYNGFRKIYEFGQYEISGPLYYSQNGYKISNTWDSNSYNNIYGENVDSCYFNFIEMGKLFKQDDFSKSDGNIYSWLSPENLSDWHLPHIDEWETIIGTSRPGATVNGSINKHFAFIEVNNYAYGGVSPTKGLLLFPDNEIINEHNNYTLSNLDDSTFNTINITRLNDYLSQGCVFLPYGGRNYNGNWYDCGTTGCYLSADEANTNNCNVLILPVAGPPSTSSFTLDKEQAYVNVRLIRDMLLK